MKNSERLKQQIESAIAIEEEYDRAYLHQERQAKELKSAQTSFDLAQMQFDEARERRKAARVLKYKIHEQDEVPRGDFRYYSQDGQNYLVSISLQACHNTGNEYLEMQVKELPTLEEDSSNDD